MAHIAGPEQDLLIFDYPLAGSFEVSLEAPHGSWQEAACSYAGLIAEPFWIGNFSQVFPVGASETVQVPWKLSRLNDFNDITVQVTPAAVRYLVNGHPFYEDKEPSPTSPWLALFTRRERHTAWRGITLKGNPEIPRAVPLCVADRLEGWVSSFYNETQPPRRMTVTTDRFGNTMNRSLRTRNRSASARRTPRAPDDPDAYDWSAQDGVIRGRRVLTPGLVKGRQYDAPGQETVSTAAASESVLTYCRPLRDGDVLSFEFRYEPGQVMVHPALDRLAFLLEPEGVRLHWLTLGPADPSGLAADNVADEPGSRRGPAPLPLKAGDWNRVEASLAGDVIRIGLNGQEIVQRRLEPENSRQFGLFHDKERTSVLVRNVVLKGRWPETLSAVDRDRLVFKPTDAAGSVAERKARHAVIGEDIYCREAGKVLAQARTLKLEERYPALASWVLPSVDHPVFRLQGSFTPSYPARGPEKAEQVRLQTGGVLEAPALGLVDAARALGKLDELADRVRTASAEGAAGARGKLALEILIQIAQGDEVVAEQSLRRLAGLLAKVGPEVPAWERWPEPVACARAIERPRLRTAALALLDPAIAFAQSKMGMTLWERQLKSLRSRAQVLSDPAMAARPSGTDPVSAPWARVTHTRARRAAAASRSPGGPCTMGRLIISRAMAMTSSISRRRFGATSSSTASSPRSTGGRSA